MGLLNDIILWEGWIKKEIFMIMLLGGAGGWGELIVAHGEWVSLLCPL